FCSLLTFSISFTCVFDVAVFSGAVSCSVTEVSIPVVLTDSGVLTVTDVDGADEAKFVAAVVTPPGAGPGSPTPTSYKKPTPAPTTP
ncbi:hypothetical protein, partial [Aeromonas salmonicida]|uniref:hypothetical protein n=1 Tax=Aeromonas salmonicida TaxID=645 RepID=UPI003D3200B2